MLTLNRSLLLDTLIKHETLTLDDISKEENLGLVPNPHHLKYLLDKLEREECILTLDGAIPRTYTITEKGIDERNLPEPQSLDAASSQVRPQDFAASMESSIAAELRTRSTNGIQN